VKLSEKSCHNTKKTNQKPSNCAQYAMVFHPLLVFFGHDVLTPGLHTLAAGGWKIRAATWTTNLGILDCW
jgi:hypothetical protein